MALPTDLHMVTAKRLLRYMNSTLQFGLALHKCEVLDLTGFYDADYVSCADERHSTLSYSVSLWENFVSWHNLKQKMMSQSNIENEYRVMVLASTEIIWHRSLLVEHSLSLLVHQSVFHARTKHIKIDHHFFMIKLFMDPYQSSMSLRITRLLIF